MMAWWLCCAREKSSLTIDGNGNGLGEVEAVGTLESGDLANGVDLEQLSGGSSRVGRSVDKLQLEVVVLSSDQDGQGATVVLYNVRDKLTKERIENVRADRRAFRTPF
jgi:hypothetical protein